MIPFDPFVALVLPPWPLIGRRVPKTLLIEDGTSAVGDRRRISEGIEELRWLPALKPAMVGIAEYRDAAREYLEIAVLKLVLRLTVRANRLIELVHRAVPYPVLLIARRDEALELSMAHKRRPLDAAGKTVIDGEIVTARIDGETTVVFRDSAFADDVAKTNLAAVLEQRGLGNVRSLCCRWVEEDGS